MTQSTTSKLSKTTPKKQSLKSSKKQPKQLRVAFINRPEHVWVGGDYVKMKKVAQGLVDLGVYVEVFERPLISPAIYTATFDIIHTWNFSMDWSKYAIWMSSKWQKKTVASMIYHEGESQVSYVNQQIMLDVLDAAIYETETEIDRVRRHLNVDETKNYIVPNGIDKWWFKKEDSNVPIKNYGLTVGRIERAKGQLEAALACRELKIPYVCIGKGVDPDYLRAVLDAGAMVFPTMTQEELKRWYKHAKVYIQASKAETWGMAVDEAGTQACPLVLSTGFERKDIPGGVYCIHEDVESIKNAISSAAPTVEFQKTLKKRTWDEVAAEYLEIYKKILWNKSEK